MATPFREDLDLAEEDPIRRKMSRQYRLKSNGFGRAAKAAALVLALGATTGTAPAQDNVLTLESAIQMALSRNEQSLAADQSYIAAKARAISESSTARIPMPSSVWRSTESEVRSR